MTGPLLSLREAAARVGHSPWAVRRAIARGDLVAYKPCGELRIPETELEAWLHASRVAPTQAAPAPRAPVVSTQRAQVGSFRARARGTE